jgi:hypothetical protein
MSDEYRHFAPSEAFAKNAIAKAGMYAEAKADRLGFWAKQARELHWHKPFTQTLDFSNPPFAKWFADGQLNISFNCLDRHVLAGNGDRTALLFEGEPGDTKEISYAELTREVKKAANALGGAVKEMERRYDVLSELGYRDITGYNKAFAKGQIQPQNTRPKSKVPASSARVQN